MNRKIGVGDLTLDRSHNGKKDIVYKKNLDLWKAIMKKYF